MVALPAFLFLAAVAVVRELLGGAGSGVGVLLVLPVVWIALHGTRNQLLAIVAAMAVYLLVPIVLWTSSVDAFVCLRVAASAVVVAGIIGFTVRRLVGQVRRQAADAEQREQDLEAVARVARTLGGDGARERICEALCSVAGAAFAILFEPDGSGRVQSTAIFGVELEPAVLDPGREVSTTFLALTSGRRIFVADAASHPSMNPTLWWAAGRPASMLFEPVLRGDACVGVLVAGWSLRLDAAADRASAVVGLLAAEAAVAIERADLVARLSEQARTDPLTGLANRRVWEERIGETYREAVRTGGTLTVALIDLDDFKLVNDAGGHDHGDRVLKSCAAAWAAELRANDTLARVGGDEFALLLSGCPLAVSLETLERLRRVLPAGLTISAGAAAWRAGESEQELIARADAALYAAKTAGRDRTVTSQDTHVG
jgi:diguanylate cyclase (GGDEF)-like protein